jgi:hypothetical protein
MTDNIFSSSVFAVIATMAVAVGASAFHPDIRNVTFGEKPAVVASASAPQVVQMPEVTVIGRRYPTSEHIDVAAAQSAAAAGQ